MTQKKGWIIHSLSAPIQDVFFLDGGFFTRLIVLAAQIANLIGLAALADDRRTDARSDAVKKSAKRCAGQKSFAALSAFPFAPRSMAR